MVLSGVLCDQQAAQSSAAGIQTLSEILRVLSKLLSSKKYKLLKNVLQSVNYDSLSELSVVRNIFAEEYVTAQTLKFISKLIDLGSGKYNDTNKIIWMFIYNIVTFK